MKAYYFSHGRSIFASDFTSLQARQNALNYVFENNIYTILRIDQGLCLCTKNNGIIRNDIEANVLFYSLERVIPQ